jgi:hypothetical protein
MAWTCKSTTSSTVLFLHDEPVLVIDQGDHQTLASHFVGSMELDSAMFKAAYRLRCMELGVIWLPFDESYALSQDSVARYEAAVAAIGARKMIASQASKADITLTSSMERKPAPAKPSVEAGAAQASAAVAALTAPILGKL